jgi:hypothetical protein
MNCVFILLKTLCIIVVGINPIFGSYTVAKETIKHSRRDFLKLSNKTSKMPY